MPVSPSPARSPAEKNDYVDPKPDDIQPTNSEKDIVQENNCNDEKPEPVDEEPTSEQVNSQPQNATEPVDPQPGSDELPDPQKLDEEKDTDTNQVDSEAQPQETGEEDIVRSSAVVSGAQPVSDELAPPQEPRERETDSHPDGSDTIIDVVVVSLQTKPEQVDSHPKEPKEAMDTEASDSHPNEPEEAMDIEASDLPPMEPEETMDVEVPDSQPEEVDSQLQAASEPVDSQRTDGEIAHPLPPGEEDIYVPLQGSSELLHEHSQPFGQDIVDCEPEDPQPTDTEHANMVKPEQTEREPMVNSQPRDEQIHSQSQTLSEPADSHPMSHDGIAHPQPLGEEDLYSHPMGEEVDPDSHNDLHPLSHDGLAHPQPLGEEDLYSHPMGGEVDPEAHNDGGLDDSHPQSHDGLAHPEPLGEVDIYSHPMDGEVDPQSHNGDLPADSHPMSLDGLTHPQPLGEEDIYSHPMSSELVHSHVVSEEMAPLQRVTAELAYTQSINSEVVHSQAVSSEHMQLSHVNMDPLGMELVNSHSVGNELLYAQEPLRTEHPKSQQITPETQPSKRRKKKSIVWEHFTIETVGAGCRRACCMVCKQSFAYSTGSKVAGTSHLKRHIAKGGCPVILRQQEKNQLTAYVPKSEAGVDNTASSRPKRRYRTSSAPYLIFDQDRCRHEIARMIIMHDYPLHMVEHPSFVAFIQNLQPRFDMVSFNIVQGDCVATFLREKQNLQRFIEGIPGRVCLTLDMWASSYSTGYVFVTGQFIDNDWKLHKRLLNVVMEPFPESDRALSHAVGTCLSDWGLDRKLASITFNQHLTESGLESLRALLAVKNPLLLNGQLLIRNCIARTLSSMAQDVLSAGQETIIKIRASVKYVKTSESHEEKFLELKQHLQVPTEKSLSLDNTTKWNTTYEMLSSASEMKEVFSCLDTSDPEYKEAPSMEDWKQVENICMYLKLLYDTASMLTVKNPQSTNVFFHEVWKIQLELARSSSSDDRFVSGLAFPLQEKFHKYWKNSCLVLAIAVAMDPRFKMKLVEFSFTKIFGEEAPIYIRAVDDGIHELFHEYVNLPLPLATAYTEDGSCGNNINGDDEQHLTSNGLLDFDMYIMETTSQQMKSELDQYLEESLLPRIQDFDVLGWWKLHKIKYPTLSKMARDILSIPISTVPHDSIFETVGKEMDSYRSSLRPETVEALICAKDWLQQESTKSGIEPVKMEQL